MNLGMMKRRIGEKNGPVYLMTAKSNPEVFAICLAQRWCTAEGMTYEEAAAVEDIGRVFENSNIVSFNELKYFGITSLMMYSFNGVSSLTEISLPNTLTTIGSNAFYGLTNLIKIEFSNKITSISSNTFYGCNKLQRIELPITIISIGTNAFRNCSRLQSITIRATTPPSLGNSYVFNGTNNCPIYVPLESVSAYKEKTYWAGFANRIQAIPS